MYTSRVLELICLHSCALYPQIHTPYGYEALVQNQRWAKANTAQISTTTSGVITQTNHRTFCVDLWLRTYDCGHFQKNGVPCGHAFTLIQALQACINSHPQPPRDYMHLSPQPKGSFT